MTTIDARDLWGISSCLHAPRGEFAAERLSSSTDDG